MNQQPQTAKAVLNTLTNAYAGLPATLQKAARYIIDNPRDVGVASMRSLAVKLSVHPNAFVRLARRIGFEGYDEMRERFRDFVRGDDLGSFRDRATWLQEMAEKGGSAAIVGDMAAAITDNVERSFRKQDIVQLDAVCEAILKAQHVYVLGLGSGLSLAHQFWYVARMAFGKFSLIPRHGSLAIDEVADIGCDDLLMALTFQPYRTEILETVGIVKKKGIPIVGITDSDTSPLAREADHPLICPTHTPQFFQSNAAVISLMETLTALLVARGGKDVRARIDAFHNERFEAGIYEEKAFRVQSGNG